MRDDRQDRPRHHRVDQADKKPQVARQSEKKRGGESREARKTEKMEGKRPEKEPREEY